jgi:adenylosuccinate synthase
MITTPYDIAYNRALEQIHNHGSCGIGVGATIERNTLSNATLYAEDIVSYETVKEKLQEIELYYIHKISVLGCDSLTQAYRQAIQDKQLITEFHKQVGEVLQVIEIVSEDIILPVYDSYIFEGSQGVLLDEKHGFFPHVTRGFTTSKNAMEIIARCHLPEPTIYYVTRAYQTRHGNGPMTNEDKVLELQNTEYETNIFNKWQGNFRRSMLDLDLLSHAIQSDIQYSGNTKKALIITCIDQLYGPLQCTKNKIVLSPSLQELCNGLLPIQFSKGYFNSGGKASTMQNIIL